MVLSVIKYLRPDCRLCCKPRCLIVSRLIRHWRRRSPENARFRERSQRCLMHYVRAFHKTRRIVNRL